MMEFCLVASHGYPSGLVFHPEQGICRVSKDCQPFLASGLRQEMTRSGTLNLRLHQTEVPWKPTSGLSESSQFVKMDSTTRRPVLIDVQDTRPNSILFSFGIAEQCKRHDKILKFLISGSSEVQKGGLDLSVLSDLMGLQALTSDMPQHQSAPYCGSCFCDAESQPSLIYPDGQVSFMGAGTEMKDVLSVIAEFYLSKNSTNWRKQSVLVPHFNRCWLDSSGARANIHVSSLKLETVTVAPIKSPGKIKLKPSKKRKGNQNAGKERDLYGKNYLHACESLLSIMVDKKRHGKTAICALKKSSPELPHLLTQFSASIAGTGLAVLFSVIYKVASGRVPFCASKLLNTGLGLGLVWFSRAVNRLRDTMMYISKNSGKLGLKEEDMMKNLDRSVNEIYFRAATLVALVVLRLA